ncbi:ATP-binding protein [Cytophagaceae bacterium DM2B3-1]|uniref:ATP-binding protein n=1 Tax=Xanthocytophaga flava TaxID=3048013 RepID=A0AAE3QL36_9BACT|nr:ATP-binding protein [Xanthocytophaga flavus]MDJ1470117.1 ATP-binding protein [Xanthocytophaga flavus]MDJ1481342.1 ATP-binding protein [Xanthocytophaga flavus]MDJ1491320.1 ATP-binding protein [Xanthocytophaga flavus]
MDFATMKALVKQGEGMNIEFKLKAAHPDKIVREIVAFANSEGGNLLVGISDDKQIKGVKFVDEEEYILTRAIEKYCHPPISYQTYRILVGEERHVLVLTIPPSNEKPHYVIHDITNNIGKAYVRLADKSIQASKEVREVLKGERKQRNIRFQYGDKEKILMQYLGANPYITVSQFMEAANISRTIASRTLVLLVLAHVLKISPHETEDQFTAIE